MVGFLLFKAKRNRRGAQTVLSLVDNVQYVFLYNYPNKSIIYVGC